MPDDQGVHAHRRHGQHGVPQRLALGHRRALGADVDHVGGEPLAGELERGAGPGGVLEEQVDHRPAAQCRQLLDRPALDLGHLLGQVEDLGRSAPRSRSAADSRWRIRSLRPLGVGGLVGTVASRRSSPRSTPSTSSSRTRTRSSARVGRFLPTWSARIGSSRWPRSTSTASRTARGRPRSPSASSAARTVRPENSTSSTSTTTASSTLDRAARCGRPPGWAGGAGRRGTSSRPARRPGSSTPSTSAIAAASRSARVDAAGGDAEQHQTRGAAVRLQDLVRHPGAGPGDLVGVEDSRDPGPGAADRRADRSATSCRQDTVPPPLPARPPGVALQRYRRGVTTPEHASASGNTFAGWPRLPIRPCCRRSACWSGSRCSCISSRSPSPRSATRPRRGPSEADRQVADPVWVGGPPGGEATLRVPPGAAAVELGSPRRRPARGVPVPAGDVFTPGELERIEHAQSHNAERSSGSDLLGLRRGRRGGRPGVRRTAAQRSRRPAPARSWCCATPSFRALEIVTGRQARRVLDDVECRLAAATMQTSFVAGDIVGGLVPASSSSAKPPGTRDPAHVAAR